VYKLSSESIPPVVLDGFYTGPSPAEGPVVPGPPYHVWPTGCCIHPILYCKNVPSLLIFGPPAAKFWRRACFYKLSGAISKTVLYFSAKKFLLADVAILWNEPTVA